MSEEPKNDSELLRKLYRVDWRYNITKVLLTIVLIIGVGLILYNQSKLLNQNRNTLLTIQRQCIIK